MTDESDEQDPVQASKTSISASEYDSDMTTDTSDVTTRTSDKTIDTSGIAKETGDIGLITELASDMTCSDATNETTLTDNDKSITSNDFPCLKMMLDEPYTN